MNFLWLVLINKIPVHPLVEATRIYVTKITDTHTQNCNLDVIDIYMMSIHDHPNLEYIDITMI
jgi:hypothetical protein